MLSAPASATILSDAVDVVYTNIHDPSNLSHWSDSTSNPHGAKDYFHIRRSPTTAYYLTPASEPIIHRLEIEAPVNENIPTSRTESRREGVISSGMRPPQSDIRRNSRNPLGIDHSEIKALSTVQPLAQTKTSDQTTSGINPRRVYPEERAPDMSKRRFSVNVFKRQARLSEEKIKEAKDFAATRRPSWLRKMPSFSRPGPSASLMHMPVPPTFVPPGLQRVVTPEFDAPAQVKGKLADFFFDMHRLQGTSRRKLHRSAGRIWDSDAILMSMEKGFDLSGDESDEAPEGHRQTRPPPFHFGPVNDAAPGMPTPPGLTRGIESQPSPRAQSPMSPGNTESWFRKRHEESSGDYQLTAAALEEADERHKFEWLVPEHLPNSPVCPLHVMYRGPSKGLCYWHGRKSNGYGAGVGRGKVSIPALIGHVSAGSSSGWSTGQSEVPKTMAKKRRLASFSSP
jgi:hypothetical protein